MTKIQSSRWSVASKFISTKLTYEDCTNHRKSSNQGRSCSVLQLLRTRTTLYTSLKRDKEYHSIVIKGWVIKRTVRTIDIHTCNNRASEIWKGTHCNPRNTQDFTGHPDKVNKETPDFLLNACYWNPSSTWGKHMYLSHTLNNTLDILWDMQTNKCNQPYQQSEGQNNMAISTDAKETRDKMVPPVLIRLYKLGVEGMYHMVKAIGGEFIASTLQWKAEGFSGTRQVVLTLSLQPSFWHSFLTRAPMMIITVSRMSLLANEPLNLLCGQAEIEHAIRTLQHSKGTLLVNKVHAFREMILCF